MRKKREKTGKKWARYGLKGVKEGSQPRINWSALMAVPVWPGPRAPRHHLRRLLLRHSHHRPCRFPGGQRGARRCGRCLQPRRFSAGGGDGGAVCADHAGGGDPLVGGQMTAAPSGRRGRRVIKLAKVYCTHNHIHKGRITTPHKAFLDHFVQLLNMSLAALPSDSATPLGPRSPVLTLVSAQREAGLAPVAHGLQTQTGEV